MKRPDGKQTAGSEEHIEALETRLAEHEQSILELSDEMYRQQQQIARLELELRHLAERLKGMAAAVPDSEPRDETPPHY